VLGFDPFERRREFLKSISLVLGQKQQLAWDLAPVDSFLLNRVIYDIPESDYRQRVGELTELMALEDVIHRPVRKLSLGERMKCELALALLHRPKLLFLDEPTIGLDVNMQQAVRSYIADYNQRYQATILLTSHYMSDVEALAHRVIVVDQAEIVFDGDLRGLVTVNEPRKVLRLWLSSPVKQEILRGYAKVSRYEGLEVNFLVERNDVPRVVSKLLAELPVADISIEEEPIERIIGSLLSGRASNR
jgi:ABC-2 type transport system ATP-binding protein